MKQTKGWATFGYLLLFILLVCRTGAAQTGTQSATTTNPSPFSLKKGDRVVFLGNSLFENDFQYGYLELALTTRFPDQDVTFRNLGWTGDNVYGVARSTITNPPTAYELLMDHLTKAQPTVVFVGYGNVEAQEGEAGLPSFTDGLNKLLDKIDQLGARAILLSTIPALSANPTPAQTEQNTRLERYAAAIAQLAAKRGKQYIDIYGPIQALSRQTKLTDNGIHLNETGYYQLATILENKLGMPARNQPVSINMSPRSNQASPGAKILTADPKNGRLQFTIDEPYLPLPLPADSGAASTKGQLLTVSGLKKGFYTLRIDNEEVVTASASDWARGIDIRQGGDLDQAHDIRQMILKKNELFFFQYRPLNTTYILGFRSYEQGRHAKGLEEQSFIIRWLESQIALHRAPASRVYQLTLLK